MSPTGSSRTPSTTTPTTATARSCEPSTTTRPSPAPTPTGTASRPTTATASPSDDIVSHEWGHAYTEYTSGLVYQWQPGAMNESYSDIWGETVDLINARHNETPDTPADRRAVLGVHPGRRRAVHQRSCAHRRALRRGSRVVRAGDRQPRASPTTWSWVAPLNGCTALTNAAAVAGNFVYVDRGTCTFDIKADNAEAAGATGIIVGQNVAGPPISMAGSANIPGLMITQDKGAAIKAEAGHRQRHDARPSAPTRSTTPTGGCPASPTRPSAARSATCGTRTATATRAR